MFSCNESGADCACSDVADVAVAPCSRDRSISRPEDDFGLMSRGSSGGGTPKTWYAA